MLVWRLDRWGRSLANLVATLQELEHLGVGFVSLTEALHLSTPSGRAFQGRLGPGEPLNSSNGHVGPQNRNFPLLNAALKMHPPSRCAVPNSGIGLNKSRTILPTRSVGRTRFSKGGAVQCSERLAHCSSLQRPASCVYKHSPRCPIRLMPAREIMALPSPGHKFLGYSYLAGLGVSRQGPAKTKGVGHWIPLKPSSEDTL